MRRFRAVLFDLDGTLLDTLRDLGESVNRMLEARGLPVHPIDAYRYLVGDGAAMLITRALPEHQRDPNTIHAALNEYRAIYEKNWNVHTRLYDGVSDLLDALVARGFRLGILSNKPHAMTLKCVEGYLSRWPFACVLGQREDIARKPHPAGALQAAAQMSVPPEEVFYLGDTSTDMQTARAAGMFAAGAAWGFRTADELWASGAQAVVERPDEVLPLIERLQND